MLYIYETNYFENDFELYKLEMKCLFDREIKDKMIVSEKLYPANRSVYFRSRIDVIAYDKDQDTLITKVKKLNLEHEGFKIIFYKSDYFDDNYEEKKQLMSKIGYEIKGYPDMKNPLILLGITKYQGVYYFGYYHKNKREYEKYAHKPYSYSSGLSVNNCRSVVNIGIKDNLNLRLIDPCCGVGGILLQAKDLGLNIKGIELNELIAKNAQVNLVHFGFDKKIVDHNDMLNEIGEYDVCLLDIPYGYFNPFELEEQIKILNKAATLCQKLVLVSNTNMDDILLKSDFKVVDKAWVKKNSFIRYITVYQK